MEYACCPEEEYQKKKKMFGSEINYNHSLAVPHCRNRLARMNFSVMKRVSLWVQTVCIGAAWIWLRGIPSFSRESMHLHRYCR